MEQLEINLSQSAFGYHGCILELYRTVVQGYYEVPSSNIVYGEAVHKYRHIMFQTGGHIPTAREEAIKTFNQEKLPAGSKSQHLGDQRHMITTAFNFWEMFVKADEDTEYVLLDGKPATEVSFSIPYYEDEWIKVNLCGTLDGIAKIKGGCYIINDIKTTSAWDRPNFFAGFKMSRQLRFYRLSLQLMAERFPDSILGQIGKTNVGCRIDGVFIKPAPIENVYMSSDVFQISQDDLAEFRMILDRRIVELSKCVQENLFPKEGVLNNSCIGKWGMCKFSDVCNASSKEVAEILLKRNFKVRKFDPLNYRGDV